MELEAQILRPRRRQAIRPLHRAGRWIEVKLEHVPIRRGRGRAGGGAGAGEGEPEQGSKDGASDVHGCL
jgi:hypothetical protein